jgi:hypothetical protein
MQRELQGNGIIVSIELFQEWFPSGLFENFFRGLIFGKGFQVSIGFWFMAVGDHSSFWHNRESRVAWRLVEGDKSEERGECSMEFGEMNGRDMKKI